MGKHIQKEATLTFDYYISDLCFFKEGTYSWKQMMKVKHSKIH